MIGIKKLNNNKIDTFIELLLSTRKIITKAETVITSSYLPAERKREETFPPHHTVTHMDGCAPLQTTLPYVECVSVPLLMKKQSNVTSPYSLQSSAVFFHSNPAAHNVSMHHENLQNHISFLEHSLPFFRSQKA